ncbi:MAG: hypothetical protein PHH41_02450 [Sulfurimonas sp.]|nr:hypothetical protein [Sulfurimonas sp.]MDD3060802.1 hypothetical protein [Sulfurimonas sp.]MDD5201982.1 hypothetical protein [Sulfurimonas sp.]
MPKSNPSDSSTALIMLLIAVLFLGAVYILSAISDKKEDLLFEINCCKEDE